MSSLKPDKVVRLSLSLLTCLLLSLSIEPVHAADPAGPIKHLVFISFDNTHLEDIEKMPNLMAFLERGALFTNGHSVLISHTAPNFISLATGQYPDKHGVPNNTFFVKGQAQTWAFWETKTPNGKPYIFSPPPWQIYTQAGMDVGVVGYSDMALESGAEAARLTPLNHPTDKLNDSYRGIAIYYKDGQRTFGSPNISWLYEAVGRFPGWDKLDGQYTLEATYQMLAHNIPVVYAYIENAHDNKNPGEYDDVLAANDQAFKSFFERLAVLGITPENTLFAFVTDEGDSYVRGGTISTSLPAWLNDNPAYRVPLQNLNVTGDSGALVYLPPGADTNRAMAAMHAVPGWLYLATPAAQALLHISQPLDPDRQPSFTAFTDVGMAYTGFISSRPGGDKLLQPNPTFLWNHGTVDPEIVGVWAALVGPNIAKTRLDTWIDQVDITPTIYWLMGLTIPAGLDGRPIHEVLRPDALPASLKANAGEVSALALAYKEINAPTGTLSFDALRVSTQGALLAGSPEGANIEQHLTLLVQGRDSLAAEMRPVLMAPYLGKPFDINTARDMRARAQALMRSVNPPQIVPRTGGTDQGLAIILLGGGLVLIAIGWWWGRRRH
ncbi:MAG: alkaline phosphatase family protein [Chloroflexi bacterium]|nr:alkaline phosphatase family protein [Chloroflexota bacterium]